MRFVFVGIEGICLVGAILTLLRVINKETNAVI